AQADVVITEIGGTIGDIESQPFLEAIRQVGREQGAQNSLYIHVTLVPFLSGSEELKTKPTQHSVRELQAAGIAPDIIVIRVDRPAEDEILHKIALFCNVGSDCVIENRTIGTLYEAPLMLEKRHFSDVVCRELGLELPAPDLADWRAMLERIRARSRRVRIALVGKYVRLHDAYLSVAEALKHAGYALGALVDIDWVDAESVTPDTAAALLGGADGLIVPGGFGGRGVEGMIAAAGYARERRMPYFGICLGMQVLVIEFARHMAGLTGANSGEFDEASPHKVIDIMPGQSAQIGRGGTMRLGSYPCAVAPDTLMARCYGAPLVHERHRHRYEFNNAYREALEGAGLVFSGQSPDGGIVETAELSGQPFYLGVQFHPEFKSRPNRAHPLFAGFVRAALERR
ncbi:MAG: CTP synthase, partial [Clostridia bacterium]|nr:CTP synthase [Clostridia bacterium]